MNTMAVGYWQEPPYFVPQAAVRVPRKVWAPLRRTEIHHGKRVELMDLSVELLVTSATAGISCEDKPDTAVWAGEQIAQIQAIGHLTRAQIGELVGVDRRSLSGWCRGETTPQSDHQARLHTVAEFVQRLYALDIGSVSDAIFASESLSDVKAAIGDHDLDRAERAVLGSTMPAPQATVMEVSPEVWDMILRLTEGDPGQPTHEVGRPAEAEASPEEQDHPTVRVHLDPSQIVGSNTMSLRNRPVV